MLHSGAGPRHLAVARIVVFGLWFVVVAVSPIEAVTLLEPEMLIQRGVMRVVPLEDLVSSPWALTAVRVAALVGCAACIAGVRPFMPVALVTVAVLLLHDGVAKSAGGFANHAQAAMMYIAAIVALFPAADALSVHRRPPRPMRPEWMYRLPLVVGAGVIAVAYSFIGTRRLVGGGPEVFLGDSVTVWLVQQSQHHSSWSFDWGLWVLESEAVAVFFAVGMFVTTVFEVLSPLTLRYWSFRWVWIAVMVLFHVGTLFTMRIFFWENLILIAVFFTGLAGVGARSQSTEPPDESSWPDERGAPRLSHPGQRRGTSPAPPG